MRYLSRRRGFRGASRHTGRLQQPALSTLLAVAISLSLALPATLLVGFATRAAPGPLVPDIDPNSVLPEPYGTDLSWSHEGGWHWVTLAYTGDNSMVGQQIQRPYYVATLVLALGPDEACATCGPINDQEQGPPYIFAGPDEPVLRDAYHDLGNGPRRKTDGQGWAAGAWYLNYSTITKTFFAWTWIPDPPPDQAAAAVAQTQGARTPLVGAAGRVFPLDGTYQLSQGFGCVPFDAVYAAAGTCPADRPSFHDGIDFAAAAGTPILAAASGTVSFVGYDGVQPDPDSVIVIQHDGPNAGFSTAYLHWEQALVKVGDQVAAGQPIALVGSVGYSTGPHLHFIVKDQSGTAIDPLTWLAGAPVGASAARSGVLEWSTLIREAAERAQVPAAFIAAIMAVESSGNPNAVSPAGAMGLMQIMPEQLTRLGVPADHWLDPASNIDAGARFIREQIDQGKSLADVAASYFGYGCDVLGTCTDQYVALVMSWMAYYTAVFGGETLPAVPLAAPPAAPPAPAPVPAPPTTPASPEPTATATATPVATEAPAPPAEETPSVTPTVQPTPTASETPTAEPTETGSATPAIAPTPGATTPPAPPAAPDDAAPAPGWLNRWLPPIPSPSAAPTPSPAPTPEAAPTPAS